MMTFKESVQDIVGLTTYDAGMLPRWLKDRLLHFNGLGVEEPLADVEVIDRFVRDSWLG